MQIQEGYLAPRFKRRLNLLKDRAKASVWITYFKTCLNAWSTQRRLSSLEEAMTLHECPFCRNGPDSIEHFATCHVCFQLFHKHSLKFGNVECYLGFYQDAYFAPWILIKLAKVLAILYIVHNSFLHASPSELPLLRPSVLISAAEISVFKA